MLLSHLVHRIATDATFAAQLQQNPGGTVTADDLDGSLVEAMLAVADGAWNWRALCALSAEDQLEGYWDAVSHESKCAPLLPSQLLQDAAFCAALRAAVAPRPASSAAPEAMVSLLDLPLLCAQTLGAPAQPAEVVTRAWGMLYTALHLLDNIEDNDTPGRVWAEWGTGPTLNITTGLLASTGLTLDLLDEHDLRAQTVRAIQRDFNQTLLEMCCGQHDDLTQAEPSLEHCWQIARAKSGTFFELACRAAARVASSDAMVVEQFAAFGQHLGMLIQITDDISGLWSWERAQSDLGADQRWTLPVAYAMSVLAPAARRQLQDALANAQRDVAAEAEAREIIISSGAALYLTAHAQMHYHAALTILQQITAPSAAQTTLLTLLQQSAPATINRAAAQTPAAQRPIAPASPAAQPDKLHMFKAPRKVATA